MEIMSIIRYACSFLGIICLAFTYKQMYGKKKVSVQKEDEFQNQ